MSRLYSFIVMAIFAGWFCLTVEAQDAQSSSEKATQADKTPAKAAVTPEIAKSQEKGPYRKLAPYIFTKIPLDTEINETFSQHNVVELLAADPNYQWAKDITFRHAVWQLEFEFKPMRMIYVDIPQPQRADAAKADLVHDLYREKHGQGLGSGSG